MAGGSQVRITSLEDLVEVRNSAKWTVFSSSQSLSTALNDPANRELDLFTKTWGSYFTSTCPIPQASLPTIGLNDFLCYLKETNAGRKLHRALVRQISREENKEESKSPNNIDDFRLMSSQLQQESKSYNIDTVPRIFLLTDFSLTDPPTFQEVLPLACLLLPEKTAITEAAHGRAAKSKTGQVRSSTDFAAAGANSSDQTMLKKAQEGARKGETIGNEGRHHSMKLLNEKLTHYLDVVEVHLAYQISQRSDIFFSTLTSQQELESFIMLIRQEVMELRLKLRTLDSTSTHRALHLYSKCRHQQRLRLVIEKLQLVAVVQQTQPTIQLLLRSSDFVGALDLITTTQDVLQQELHGIHALRHLGSQLAEIESLIGRMMEADLVDYAVQDIRTRLELPLHDTPTQEECIPSESEERLSSVVLGLMRQGKFHFLPALREALLIFLKAKIRAVIAGYLHEEEEEEVRGSMGEPPSLADIMRSMSFEAWLAMLSELFERVLHFQKAIKDCIQVISTMCAEASKLPSHQHSTSSPTTPITITDHAQLTFTASHFDSDRMCVGGEGEGGVDDGGGGLLDGEGGGGEDLARFEANTLAQEAEDMLDQLVMDDELSDARLVDVAKSHDLHVTSDLNGSSEVTGDSYVWDDSGVGSGGGIDRVCVVGEGGVGDLVREVESTVDLGQKARLEEHMAPASSTRCGVLDGGRLVVECEEVLSACCDLVHTRCAKVLTLRSRAGLLASLPSHDFLSLVLTVEEFVRGSASLTGRHCPQLRVALLSQTRVFLENFHDNSRKNLSLLLESERWRQSDVPAEVQALVQRLESGIGLQPPSSSSSSSSQLSTKFLVIHGANFAVLGTVLLLVKRLLGYCSYADSFPMLINEIMTKLIDIIKYFNTRTCDLMLGAGAMNAVGLKNITARHLAIMLRCLQAVSLLVPDLMMHFKARLAKQQHILLTQFDTVTMDLTRHCDQLQSKLRAIMDEAMHKSLAKWEVKAPVPSPCFRNINKKIIKLHENVVDILPAQQVEALFADIEVAFRLRLKEQLLKFGITNNGSSRHGLVNLELHHLEGALSSLDNVSAFGSSLFDVWTCGSDS